MRLELGTEIVFDHSSNGPTGGNGCQLTSLGDPAQSRDRRSDATTNAQDLDEPSGADDRQKLTGFDFGFLIGYRGAVLSERPKDAGGARWCATRSGGVALSADELTIFCMVPTPFQDDGSLDEPALRNHLRRLIAARQGLYLASGGAGEAHVLSPQELRRVYEIGVDESAGRVPVYAGLRESRSAADLIEIAQAAVAARVDVLQMYQLDNGHGMIPNPREQEAYWTELLETIRHPVALSIHYDAKFKAPTPFLQQLCKRYDHIVAFNLVGSSTAYFMELRDAIPDHVRFFCALPDIVQFAALGAAGGINPINNLIPYVVQNIADAYVAGDNARVAEAAKTVQRSLNIVSRWAPSTARWVKMGMKVLGIGNGVLRLPYLLPPESELQSMAQAFEKLGLSDLEAEAKAYAPR